MPVRYEAPALLYNL